MKTVAKVAGVVAGIALIGSGIGAALGGTMVFTALGGAIAASAIASVASAISIGASLLAGGRKPPQNSAENVNRLRASIDPLTPRKTVIGTTALATDIRDEEFTGAQEYFHRFIVCASHGVESIDEIWFDDKRVWTLAGGVEGEAVGYLTVAPILEGSAANAINISSRMGTTRRYTGMAYVHLRYKLTGNNKKAESPYAQGITTRITIKGKAARLPDPRNPAHDMADQATWAWDDDACRNPALALLFYLLGYRINGKLAVGKGIPPERIDLDSFITAANICDELVPAVGGGTEPRYRCDGVWSEGDSPSSVLDMLKATMNADLDDVGGRLRLTVLHNDLATPAADFTDDDILDGFTWTPTPKLDETFNVARGLYTDASDASLFQQVDYPEQREASPDGIDRILTLNLPMAESAGQAQRLAALRLARQAYGGVFQAEFQATAWKVTKNSVIRQTFAQTGFVQKLFRVASIDISPDGRVPLLLREENAAIYGAPAVVAPVDPIASTPYDPALNPFLQALADARSTLVGPTSATIEAETSGAPAAGELPALFQYTVEIDGAAVTSGVTWEVDAEGETASITDGLLTLSTLSENEVDVTVTATYGDAVRKAVLVVRKRIAGVDINTGTGGTSATDNSFTAFSSTSYGVVSDVLNTTSGSGGVVELSAPLSVKVSGAPPSSYSVTLKWQRDISGTWTDVGSEHVSTECVVDPDGFVIKGSVSANESLSLTASTPYSFRLMAKANEADGELRYLTGTASASGA